MQPVLFLSHGSEENFSKNAPFNYFTKKLSEKLSLIRPDIIICLSSLWKTEELVIGTNLRKELIYQENLHALGEKKLSYQTSNAIIFTKKVEMYLKNNGIPVKLENRAFDFGTWGVISKLFPDAKVPVIQMSVPDKEDLHYHYQLGRLLQNFSQKNVLIVVSGGLVFGKSFSESIYKERSTDSAIPKNSRDGVIDQSVIEAFSSWVNNCIIENDMNTLFDYRRKAPLVYELLNPNDLTHFNSLFIALGATHPTGLKRMHTSIDNGMSYECFMSRNLLNK